MLEQESEWYYLFLNGSRFIEVFVCSKIGFRIRVRLYQLFTSTFRQEMNLRSLDLLLNRMDLGKLVL